MSTKFKYIILLNDNTEVYVTASDVSIAHPGDLKFWDDDVESHPESTWDHPIVAYFPAGAYVYVGIEGYIE
jgi:hypothetical protein